MEMKRKFMQFLIVDFGIYCFNWMILWLTPLSGLCFLTYFLEITILLKLHSESDILPKKQKENNDKRAIHLTNNDNPYCQLFIMTYIFIYDPKTFVTK